MTLASSFSTTRSTSDTYGQVPDEGLLNTLEKQKSKLHLRGSWLRTRRFQAQLLVRRRHPSEGPAAAGQSQGRRWSRRGNLCEVLQQQGARTPLAAPASVTPVGRSSEETPTTLVAVTSYGISPTCSDGTGGYRLDQADDLDFLATFGVTP